MKVLMTADTVGGVFTYALELVDGLAERGVETALALMGRPIDADQARALERSRATYVLAQEVKLEWMDDPWRDVERAGQWLLELEAAIAPDVVHLNGYAHAALPWRAPVVVVGHSCVLSWYEAVRGHDAPPEWDRYRTAVGRGLAAADLVVAPTRTMLDALVRLYGFGGETLVIPNGRSPSSVPPRAKERLVLAAGRLWDEAKNVAALDRVAARLDAPVVVAGDAPEARAVRVVGRISSDELAEWYARAAVFAAPARYEPFGLTALEAALAGCALVLGDIPSLREVWDDAALYVGDDAELERALRRLLDDESLRAEFASRARRRARRYTPGRMADAYLEAYERVLAAEYEAAAPARAAP